MLHASPTELLYHRFLSSRINLTVRCLSTVSFSMRRCQGLFPFLRAHITESYFLTSPYASVCASHPPGVKIIWLVRSQVDRSNDPHFPMRFPSLPSCPQVRSVRLGYTTN